MSRKGISKLKSIDHVHRPSSAIFIVIDHHVIRTRQTRYNSVSRVLNEVFLGCAIACMNGWVDICRTLFQVIGKCLRG